jgi:hypothetical protein
MVMYGWRFLRESEGWGGDSTEREMSDGRWAKKGKTEEEEEKPAMSLTPPYRGAGE